MRVADFNYELPENLIAQQPLADRSASRMLHLDRTSGASYDRRFSDLPRLLRPGDLVVFNNTRVFPARLYGRMSGVKAQPVSSLNPAAREFLRGKVEVLLTRQVSNDPNEWECLVRPGRKIGMGEHLFFGENLEAEIIARGAFGERTIRFRPVADFFGLVEQIGHVPLPPYISRADQASDRQRYQTIYAQERGSAAAPTAGLHFTPEVLAQMKECGIETAEITLHVGLGTFQPIRVDQVEEHKLHREFCRVSEPAANAINRALTEKRRVVAVGTTTVRALEYMAGKSLPIRWGTGEADTFIYPGYNFRVVGALLTNFHLPQSSLLMLVCALGGTQAVLAAYNHAVAQKYRFYSYGDCMFLE